MERKWGLWFLTAFVVGNMVGSAIFMIPATLAQAASPLGATLAWLVTGLGVLTIAVVLGNLSKRKPELSAGPQSYAKALCKTEKQGQRIGFTAVWGYWVANWVSNVAIITTFAGYLSTFLPIMTSTTPLIQLGFIEITVGNLTTFFICTFVLWGTHLILIRDINKAGKLNFIATATKVGGFLFFIVVGAAMAQDWQIFESFSQPIVGQSGEIISLPEQIRLAAISTLWAFVGIESAVLLADRAKNQGDIRKATILGLTIAMVIYLGITLLTMNTLPREALIVSDKPLADALSMLIGPAGGYIMSLLALICMTGSIIGWVLVGAEVAYQGAKNEIFPQFFARTNKYDSPENALLVTNIMSQIFMLSLVSNSISEAYSFLVLVGTLAYLVPYLISGLYQVKLVVTKETYDIIPGNRIKDGIIGLCAVIYSGYVIITGTADWATFLLGIGLFAVGYFMYPFTGLAKK